MPTFFQQKADVKFAVELASSTTTYGDYNTALTAAIVLSAANANGQVGIYRVEETVSAPNGLQLAQINMPGAGTPFFFVLLGTASDVFPKSKAEANAYTTSAANSNAPVYVGRLRIRVTAP